MITSTARPEPSMPFSSPSARLAVLAAAILSLAASAFAQSVSGPGSLDQPTTNAVAPVVSPASPSVASSVQQAASAVPSLTGSSQLRAPGALPAAGLEPLLVWGPLAVQPHLTYRLSYAEGLQGLPGSLGHSVINEISPGVLLRWDPHWTLDYTPTLTYYSSRAFRDTLTHAVTLAGATTYEDWAFGLSQSYVSSAYPLIETGSQLDQEAFSTGLTAARQLGSKTSLELGANQYFRFVSNPLPGQLLSDSRTWSTMDWLNSKVSSQVSASLGAGFTYDNIQTGPDMTSEQLQGRVSWQPLDKFSISLSGGVEDRQFLSSGASDLVSPVFSLSARYSPFESTTFSLSATRTISPSYYQDQVTEATSVSAGFHQRLLGQLALDLAGGFGNSTYHAATTAPVSSVSNYDTTFFSARLSTPFLKRGSVALFYSANYNSSGAALYDYTTTQAGLELSFRY